MKSYISALNYASILIAILYVISMFVYPWVNSGWNWQFVQRVWHDWQALNVGALAYASSIILYNMAIHSSRQHKEQEFAASKAFLPEALSELIGYLRDCSPTLQEA